MEALQEAVEKGFSLDALGDQALRANGVKRFAQHCVNFARGWQSCARRPATQFSGAAEIASLALTWTAPLGGFIFAFGLASPLFLLPS